MRAALGLALAFVAAAAFAAPPPYQAPGTSAYVAGPRELTQPAGQVVTAFIDFNVNTTGYPMWVAWKEPASCGCN